jgi:hypothetical protein
MNRMRRGRWEDDRFIERYWRRGFYVIRVKDWSRYVCVGWEELTDLTGKWKDEIDRGLVRIGDGMVYNDGEWMILTEYLCGDRERRLSVRNGREIIELGK